METKEEENSSSWTKVTTVTNSTNLVNRFTASDNQSSCFIRCSCIGECNIFINEIWSFVYENKNDKEKQKYDKKLLRLKEKFSKKRNSKLLTTKRRSTAPLIDSKYLQSLYDQLLSNKMKELEYIKLNKYTKRKEILKNLKRGTYILTTICPLLKLPGPYRIVTVEVLCYDKNGETTHKSLHKLTKNNKVSTCSFFVCSDDEPSTLIVLYDTTRFFSGISTASFLNWTPAEITLEDISVKAHLLENHGVLIATNDNHDIIGDVQFLSIDESKSFSDLATKPPEASNLSISSERSDMSNYVKKTIDTIRNTKLNQNEVTFERHVAWASSKYAFVGPRGSFIQNLAIEKQPHFTATDNLFLAPSFIDSNTAEPSKISSPVTSPITSPVTSPNSSRANSPRLSEINSSVATLLEEKRMPTQHSYARKWWYSIVVKNESHFVSPIKRRIIQFEINLSQYDSLLFKKTVEVECGDGIEISLRYTFNEDEIEGLEVASAKKFEIDYSSVALLRIRASCTHVLGAKANLILYRYCSSQIAHLFSNTIAKTKPQEDVLDIDFDFAPVQHTDTHFSTLLTTQPLRDLVATQLKTMKDYHSQSEIVSDCTKLFLLKVRKYYKKPWKVFIKTVEQDIHDTLLSIILQPDYEKFAGELTWYINSTDCLRNLISEFAATYAKLFNHQKATINSKKEASEEEHTHLAPDVQFKDAIHELQLFLLVFGGRLLPGLVTMQEPLTSDGDSRDDSIGLNDATDNSDSCAPEIYIDLEEEEDRKQFCISIFRSIVLPVVYDTVFAQYVEHYSSENEQIIKNCTFALSQPIEWQLEACGISKKLSTKLLEASQNERATIDVTLTSSVEDNYFKTCLLHLSQLSKAKTAKDKLRVVSNAVRQIEQAISELFGSFGADELLPTFCFMCIRVGFTQLKSESQFINEFLDAHLATSLYGYLLAQLEVVTGFLSESFNDFNHPVNDAKVD